MDYIEKDPLPDICLHCADRLGCLARGEGEWCCEECETLQDRFHLPLPQSSPLTRTFAEQKCLVTAKDRKSAAWQ